ncbi:sulfotransferase [Altericroceibacterium spongiae]|uniref:Sulfotransferase n=1 Tax=Altericroceibacterium spongiae TaxID=2320269 RepID=A0A420E9A9_9SPHN|nr:sulfotransferase [Altericroceibacterium spongiae]RKF15977.1 sulfotransferase [Altericroceibacterium spongiae]
MRAIFIVGCPRSGTTLLQSLLACIPDTTTFKESHLFSRSLRHTGPITITRRDVDKEIDRFWLENALPEANRPAAQPMSTKIWPHRTADAAFEALVAAARSRGSGIFIEKTPRHLHFVRQIGEAGVRAGVDTRFIHLVRDGIAVSASLENASKNWHRSHDPYAALRRWQDDIRRSVAWLGLPGHVFVNYEDLSTEPEAESVRLAQELGVSLSKNDLEKRSERLLNIVRPDETWKLVDDGSQVAPSKRSYEHLSSETLAQLEAQIDRADFMKLNTFIKGNNIK